MVSGAEELLGATGEIVDAAPDVARMRVHGEHWRVTSAAPRRVKIIHAEGELQASDKLLEAAHKLAQAMQLRYPQTLTAIAGDRSSTIVFPMPIDLMATLMERSSQRSNSSQAG